MGLIVTTSGNDKLYYSTTYNPVQINKNVVDVAYEFNDPENPKIMTDVIQTWGYTISATFSVWNNEEDYVNKDGPSIINTTAVSITSNTIPADIYATVYAALKETLSGTIVDDN